MGHKLCRVRLDDGVPGCPHVWCLKIEGDKYCDVSEAISLPCILKHKASYVYLVLV